MFGCLDLFDDSSQPLEPGSGPHNCSTIVELSDNHLGLCPNIAKQLDDQNQIECQIVELVRQPNPAKGIYYRIVHQFHHLNLIERVTVKKLLTDCH